MRSRLVQIPLEGSVSAADACLLVRGDARPFALVGEWAGGGAIVGSEPVRAAREGEDPFELMDEQPEVDAASPAVGAVGGGWFGYLGYALGALVEHVPPAPPRPVPLPRFALAYYDHVLRVDPHGSWWFEALWTDGRAAALNERLEILRARLAAGVVGAPVEVGEFAAAAPGTAGHLAAVAECRERIAAGEIFQASLCLRLDASFAGGAADLFARAARALEPAYGAFVGGPWGAVCSMSPELFLRRTGRRVVSEPIKGTAPRAPGARAGSGDGPLSCSARAELAASAKDRAENVMIADLMRNDLGRVCEYGSISVPALAEPRPGPGVWHLVSTVEGTLRPDVGDAELLRASFPPGSVTGAPKIQAMRVIAELESSGREIYTGAVGYASPLAGLELNVAIRTFEVRGERIWLGAGGGIVADSDPERELEECRVKARPVIAAAGGRLAGDAPLQPAPAVPSRALDGAADRPDPALGVFTTILARAGEPVDAGAHLERLGASVRELYGRPLPDNLRRVVRAAAGPGLARVRVTAIPATDGAGIDVDVAAEPLTLPAAPSPVVLVPAALPGGLGEHKWVDRRLLAALEHRQPGVPLIVDLDGEVLEAAHANVWVVEGSSLVTPPLDGRQLPGTARARLLTVARAIGVEVREEAVTLERAAAADELLLTSSLRGVHPAVLAGGGGGGFELGARLQAGLLEQPLGVA
jgi:para-aminobenzoate synthetase/4-amino-4-deoxychorismate lyase